MKYYSDTNVILLYINLRTRSEKTMFRYVIYGRTENEANELLKLAGTNDIEDAKQIIFNYYARTEKIYFVGSDEVVTFGVLDTQTNETINLY